MKTIVKIKIADVTLTVEWLGGDEYYVVGHTDRGREFYREYAPTLAYAFYLVARFSAVEADTDGSIDSLIYTV